jgi:hypothetical protein
MPHAPRDNRSKASASAPEEIPAFMKADSSGMDKWGPDDLPWMGDKGDLDVEQLLAEPGYDPPSPLEYILLAVIDGNPVQPAPERKSTKPRKQSPNKRDSGSRSTREGRLETALAALTGTIRRKRGMDEKDDYELLLQIAWKYHCLFWTNGNKPAEIDPIVRACIEPLPSKDPRVQMAKTSSVVARLRKKFLKNKDLYLVRATEQRNIERMDRLKDLEAILKRMEKLGIRLDLGALRPLVIYPDAKTRL